MSTAMEPAASATKAVAMQATGLVKRYGRVTALDHADFTLYEDEILAVIGDNGAGKSSLIKALCGAVVPDEGTIELFGEPAAFANPLQARDAGVGIVYQNLAMSPALDISSNLFLGRELRRPGVLGSVFRMLDRKAMNDFSREQMSNLGLLTIQNISQSVETLSGGQRQGVAVARAAAFAQNPQVEELSGGQRQGVAVARATAFATRVIFMDEPTAALGVKESRRVLNLIKEVRGRGLPVVIISHNMPHVFEVADRIHIQRLGRRVATITPESHSMADAVAIMTGAQAPEPQYAG
ncbi:MAG TPA: ATP-binding cassette domain-containing protein [Euzebya sp.]|nr:ATP-binding cassette domain-containing protein [Euzebya sp.]